jgi:hypothetical protein
MCADLPSSMMVARPAKGAGGPQEAEDAPMHPYQPLSGRDAVAQREQLWTTILDYRYAAGPKLAIDDQRERVCGEVARSLVLRAAGAASGPCPRFATFRQRFGTCLVRIGERVRGAAGPRHAEPGAASPAVQSGSHRVAARGWVAVGNPGGARKRWS